MGDPLPVARRPGAWVKYLPSQLSYFFQGAATRRNVARLLRFIAVLLLLMALYTVLFHFIMEYEGRDYSWISGLYWTLTMMSTLGLGDIVFQSDLGRAFSILVLLSGVVFLLVMLPFTFIQFFYAPWLEAQSRARAPRELPRDLSGHIVFTQFEPIGTALVKRLQRLGYGYSFVIPELGRALELHDQNYRVMVGDLDDPETYRRCRVDHATMVVAMNDDITSTNIAFTIREISEHVPIVTNADLDDSVDNLQLAGSNHVFQFTKMLGRAIGRRVLSAGMRPTVIGQLDELLVAEAVAMRTPLEGKSLRESRLREVTGLTVVGVWERGRFHVPRPETPMGPSTVLVLAGSEQDFRRYEDRMAGETPPAPGAVLILGAGRVGRAAAEVLEERGIAYRVVEKNARVAGQDDRYIIGSASDVEVLIKAGIREASAVIVTTHNDNLNIYLSIYCRRLRPDIQILSRATLERNVSTLHRAGADMVMSYASMGAATILNLLRPGQLLLLEEGLEVFRASVPPALANRSLRDNRIRELTGSSVVAIRSGETMTLNPDASVVLREGDELILIGSPDAETAFVRRYPKS
jgi:Trk K+ transport system NAD-binding subunit